MEYNYCRISEELGQLGRRSVQLWFVLMAGAAFCIGFLCAAGVLPLQAAWALFGLALSAAVLTLVFYFYRKKAEGLNRKQQISAMTIQAKQAIDTLQQDFPDTFASDCRIQMRCLTQNGIDADGAIKRLNGNVDSYNRLVLSFLEDSDELEDELFDLMQPETLLQYGYYAHSLRVKAAALGAVTLTDTALFHEAQAYVGNFDLVRDNWKKLSFELDEVYGVLFEYIKLLGLENSAADGKENLMTFKRWGERLQEAFNALYTYDTAKARQILSELIKYQIDAEITKTLQGIIANIDEIMAN